MQNSIMLYREVAKSVRYYSIRIYLTLFSEYILEKKYGSIKNYKPTGIITQHHDNINSAFNDMKKTIALKAKKGYRVSKTK